MKKRIFVLKNSIFKDHRGYYWTTWTNKNFKKLKFNHDKFSISKKNVLRGFHCDSRSWKLVTCVYGKLVLVVVNVDKKDNNYLQTKKFILDHKKPKSVLIPPTFANAHLCISNICVFHYKWSYKGKYPDIKNQKSFKWNDPKFKIKWPIKNPILSKRDTSARFLK